MAVIAVSIQAAANHNNNFEIFRTSWFSLVTGRDLYAPSPRHLDVFLYSPTFALLFAPFAVVPFWLGVLLWNAVNAAALYWGLGRVLATDHAFAARAIVLMDTIGSMQNVQSNALVAGLMIIGFAELERRREFRAALAIAGGTLIKIFPIVAAVFSVFRPWRLPRFALYSLALALALIAAPLLFMSPSQLVEQYRHWMTVQRNNDPGYSVMQHLRLWFDLDWPTWAVQIAGVVILLAPLARLSYWGLPRFRLLFLSSVLMFCVLFNHGAESPSFVIAVAGVAIWFAISTRDRLDWAVLAIVVVGTILSASDAMPAVLRQRVFVPYKLKTLPILLVWVITQVQLWSRSASAPLRATESVQELPAT